MSLGDLLMSQTGADDFPHEKFGQQEMAWCDTDSDSNIGPKKNHGPSGKRLMSSSEEETSQQQCHQMLSSANHCATPSSEGDGGRRDSLRKRQKKFRLPSREEQWSSIPTDSKVSNKLSRLTPRKLINDFTRVTHRYNYDYEEVSGEESMEEFIKGTDSSESSGDSSTTKEATKSRRRGHRVKGYRPRIVKGLDESSEEDGPDSSHLQNDANTHLADHPEITDTGQQQCKPSKRKRQEQPDTNGGRHSKETSANNSQEKNHVSSDEDSQPVISAKKSRRKSKLDSDDEENGQNSSSPTLKAHQSSEKPNALDSNSDEESQDIVGGSTRKTKTKSALLSDSESEGKDPADQNPPTAKQLHVPDDPYQEKRQETAAKDTCSSQTPKKGLVAERQVKRISASSDDNAITVHDSDSMTSDGNGDSSASDDASRTDSSDGEGCTGRIQKMAARKRQERDSKFGHLKSLRAKRQQKNVNQK
ncbi:uncharacterized protein LOC143282077 [Babylonia areolata]|uniref:uncharacterized protein LOC143282077 n=1 Tax=Babylonia areolata TaxID=304850 RepID=UPI003FD63135